MTKQKADIAVNTVFNTIADELAKGESVTIKDFSYFKTIIKGAYEGYNPVIKEKIEIPPNKVVVFKASKKLNDKIKEETHKKFYSGKK